VIDSYALDALVRLLRKRAHHTAQLAAIEQELSIVIEKLVRKVSEHDLSGVPTTRCPSDR
jgi:hypothetical protein